MTIRGLNYVAQAISQAHIQLETMKQQQSIEAENSEQRMHGDQQEHALATSEQEIIADLEQQILDNTSTRSGLRCPCCEQEMVDLHSHNTKLSYCLMCCSMWFKQGALSSLLHNHKDIPSDDLVSRLSRYDCPRCAEQMREYVFRNPHNLLVDSCTRCHGVLLEHDELQRAFNLS